MPENGFGSPLYRNMQAVRFGKEGGIFAPIRANGRDGLVFGVDAIAAADARRARSAVPKEKSSRGWRRLFRR